MDHVAVLLVELGLLPGQRRRRALLRLAQLCLCGRALLLELGLRLRTDAVELLLGLLPLALQLLGGEVLDVRTLLAQAVALDSEARHLKSELNEVI